MEYSTSGTEENKSISFEIISNSPLMGNAGNNKIIKISGYKALAARSGDGGNVSYNL